MEMPAELKAIGETQLSDTTNNRGGFADELERPVALATLAESGPQR